MMHYLSYLPVLAALIALGYQIFALLGAIVYFAKSAFLLSKPTGSYTPPVSILKPVRGLDSALHDALLSHMTQDYPDYEILIGVRDMEDPAVPVIRQLITEHPEHPIRLIHCQTDTPNAKVGILIDLARQARHEIILVNDADISVPPQYLRRVAAPLAEPRNGLVTCLYHATAHSIPGNWEALGIATDFIPSTLVAPMVGINEFGLGSTLCFRKTDLAAIGGFDAVKEFIADDYQLAKRITQLGRETVLSEVVVGTTLNAPTWRDVWRHQVRWARTIRVSRRGGYLGLPVTHAGLWAIVAMLTGHWPLGLTLWLARATMGATAGFVVLRHWPALLAAPLLPLWDLWAFTIWLTGLAGRTVHWRNKQMTLNRDGRISES
ncbi:MAG: bacteriohopanetetrol glucosamine biosynthesis glycosyltransferase HpnI [Bryobacterales bacterium]|nr:bacteriohopanetetrol glucosamine biosynthesis glycosyltransferase HpnI [Bryobacterales bacterium]